MNKSSRHGFIVMHNIAFSRNFKDVRKFIFHIAIVLGSRSIVESHQAYLMALLEYVMLFILHLNQRAKFIQQDFIVGLQNNAVVYCNA